MINIINVSKGTYNGWTIVSNKSECAFILSRTGKTLVFPLQDDVHFTYRMLLWVTILYYHCAG